MYHTKSFCINIVYNTSQNYIYKQYNMLTVQVCSQGYEFTQGKIFCQSDICILLFRSDSEEKHKISSRILNYLDFIHVFKVKIYSLYLEIKTMFFQSTPATQKYSSIYTVCHLYFSLFCCCNFPHYATHINFVILCVLCLIWEHFFSVTTGII